VKWDQNGAHLPQKIYLFAEPIYTLDVISDTV